MEQVGITIVGAGVIGLAIAAELSKTYADIIVIEKEHSFGQETSSRNSEVIHAGIYYPQNSLKAKTCIEGKQLLYEYCHKNNIGYKKTGKLIVAVDDNELKSLENLFNNGLENGVKDLNILSKVEIKKIEPHIKAQAAIYSPSTGILDTHALLKNLVLELKSRNAEIVYNTEVVNIDKDKEGFKVCVEDEREGSFSFVTKVLINSAGLYSDKVAQMVGINKDEYKLKYCKGDYFRVHNNKNKFINRLIYPVPGKEKSSLGIHATLDLAGGLRLGPDEEYINDINYDINEAKRKYFHEGVKSFLPFIELEDLTPDTAGIRPKLQGPKENFRDFLIKDESDKDLAGFISLIGIESPGLTSSFSIAKRVKNMVKNFLV